MNASQLFAIYWSYLQVKKEMKVKPRKVKIKRDFAEKKRQKINTTYTSGSLRSVVCQSRSLWRRYSQFLGVSARLLWGGEGGPKNARKIKWKARQIVFSERSGNKKFQNRPTPWKISAHATDQVQYKFKTNTLLFTTCISSYKRS